MDADVIFQIGSAAMGAAQQPGLSEAQRDALLDDAIKIFHGLLVLRPDLVRVRLELARAFFLRERDGLARRHFEIALAADPPAPVVANINRHLSIIRARKRWQGHFGFALAPDTNIGAASADETVLLDAFGQPLQFTLDNGGSSPASGLRSGLASSARSRLRRTGACASRQRVPARVCRIEV